MVGADHVRGLHHRRDRRRVADVDRVVGQQRAAQLEDQAHDAQVALRVGVEQRARSASGSRRLSAGGCSVAMREVEALGLAVDHDAAHARRPRRRAPRRRRPRRTLGAELGGARAGGLDQALVTAAQAAHRLARALRRARRAHAVGARPQVRGGQLGVVGRRSASPAAGARCGPTTRVAAVAAQPADQRHVLERGVVLAQLALGHEPRQARAPQRRAAAEKRAKSPRPLNGYILPSTKKPTPTGREAQLLAQVELVDERQHALVGGHDHVVEAVDPVAAEVEGSGQAAQRRAALEQGDLRARLLQAQRERGAEDAAPDDADAGSHATSSSRRVVDGAVVDAQRRERRRLDAADDVGGHQAAVGEHGGPEAHLRDAAGAGSSR